MILNNARGFEYGVRHFYSPKSGLLAQIISESLELPLENAQWLITFGCVYVEKQRIAPQIGDEDIWIHQGQYLRVHTKPRRFPLEKRAGSVELVFENTNFVIVNKPHGLPCHPTVDNLQENLLAEWALKYPDKPLFLTHRLDVPTSGLLVLAKNAQAQTAFNGLLKSGQLKKTYHAELSKTPSCWGLWEHWMEPSPKAPKNVAAQAQGNDWQQCLLEINPLQNKENSVIAEVQLLTGRTHQIRAQASFMNCPIVGDIAYGGPRLYDYERIHLSAVQICFEDVISNERIEVTIDRSF